MESTVDTKPAHVAVDMEELAQALNSFFLVALLQLGKKGSLVGTDPLDSYVAVFIDREEFTFKLDIPQLGMSADTKGVILYRSKDELVEYVVVRTVDFYENGFDNALAVQQVFTVPSNEDGDETTVELIKTILGVDTYCTDCKVVKMKLVMGTTFVCPSCGAQNSTA